MLPLLVGQDLILDGMIERLTLDHEEIEQWWAELAGFLATPEKISDTNRPVEFALQFERLQREHLTRENENFQSRVDEALNIFHRQQVGQGMASLRGLSAAA